jgi:hypothetical protein
MALAARLWAVGLGLTLSFPSIASAVTVPDASAIAHPGTTLTQQPELAAASLPSDAFSIRLVTDFGSAPRVPGAGSPNTMISGPDNTPIPEPASTGLLVLGLAALTARYRRPSSARRRMSML